MREKKEDKGAFWVRMGNYFLIPVVFLVLAFAYNLLQFQDGVLWLFSDGIQSLLNWMGIKQ